MVADTLLFTIANIKGEQLCVGRIVRKSISLFDEILTYSGGYICNFGKVVGGNHFFITEARGIDNEEHKRFVIDLVFDQSLTMRFITEEF